MPAILEHVTDDATFGFNVDQPVLPWHRTFRGKGELPRFFAAIGEGTTVREFRPESFVASGPHVVVSVRFTHTLKNGRERVEEQVHWWTFDARGEVTRATGALHGYGEGRGRGANELAELRRGGTNDVAKRDIRAGRRRGKTSFRTESP